MGDQDKLERQGAPGDRENMKMSNKESGNATLQGSTRGGNVTVREKYREN